MAEMIDREFLNSENRIWLENDAGEEIAFISFPYVGSGRKLVCIDHTVVDPSLQGQGIASRLVREAVESIRKDGKKCLVTCSYAQAWFGKQTEYMFLLVGPDEAALLKDQD